MLTPVCLSQQWLFRNFISHIYIWTCVLSETKNKILVVFCLTRIDFVAMLRYDSIESRINSKFERNMLCDYAIYQLNRLGGMSSNNYKYVAAGCVAISRNHCQFCAFHFAEMSSGPACLWILYNHRSVLYSSNLCVDL